MSVSWLKQENILLHRKLVLNGQIEHDTNDLLLLVVEFLSSFSSSSITHTSGRIEGRTTSASLGKPGIGLQRGHEHPFCMLLVLQLIVTVFGVFELAIAAPMALI